MITREHPEFFRVLSGKNATMYESILVTLYDEIYRGTMGETLVNRTYIRNLIYREMKNFDWEKHMDESISSTQVAVQNIMNRFINEGWIESKYDNLAMDHIFNFTRTGRKFAQVLHQMNSKYLATRHRNVRTTLSFLEAYRDKGDPYDLVDATEASDYIVSDLMDQINEIHEVRKMLVRQAMENLEVAGENFFDFLENDFRSSVTVHLTEDSVSHYAVNINTIINEIMSDLNSIDVRNKKLIERYPHLKEISAPVENYLIQISSRVQNARDHKIPELLEAIESLFKSSEMVLKQAGSLLIKNSSSIKTLAAIIKEAPEEKKAKYLEQFGFILNLLNAKHLDPKKIEIKKQSSRRKIKSVVIDQEPPSPEKLQEIKIRSEIRKAIGYTSKEVEKYIDKVLEDEDSIINAFMPIETYKELNMSLHAAAVALKTGAYTITATGKFTTNRYYAVDGYIITKKDNS